MQNYTGIYNDFHDKYRNYIDKEDISDDIVFEMELVKQIEVNIDYILMLVEKYHKSNCEDKAILTAIDTAIKSSLELRSKKALIDAFVATITVKTDVNSEWASFVRGQQVKDLEALVVEENLNAKETRKYLLNAFREGQIQTNGTDINKVLPPVSRFGNKNRALKKQAVIKKLKAFFDKYYGLGIVSFD